MFFFRCYADEFPVFVSGYVATRSFDGKYLCIQISAQHLLLLDHTFDVDCCEVRSISRNVCNQGLEMALNLVMNEWATLFVTRFYIEFLFFCTHSDFSGKLLQCWQRIGMWRSFSPMSVIVPFGSETASVWTTFSLLVTIWPDSSSASDIPMSVL